MDYEQIQKEIRDIIKAEVWSPHGIIEGHDDAASSLMVFLEPWIDTAMQCQCKESNLND